MERYGGTLPQTYDELLSLPGFGPYTAGAVASIAFGESVPAVDGNVLRVISRLAGYEDDIMLPAVRKAFFGCLLPCMEERPGDLNQAFMDLGALVCLPNGKPRCESCPVSFCCEAHAKGQELLFPVKRTKASRRAEQRTVLVIAAQGRILLHKRPDRGLLAGLWEFVNLEGHLTADEVSAYCRELGLEVKEIMSHKTAKHIFTHIEWHMNSFCVKATRCEEIDGCVWADGFALNERHSVPSAFSAFKETAAELIGLY